MIPRSYVCLATFGAVGGKVNVFFPELKFAFENYSPFWFRH